MSFATTRNNINNIEKMSSISSDDMLTVMEDIYKDVLKHNGAEKVEDILPSDADKLLLKEYALLNILLPIYNGHRDKIAEKPEVIRNRYIKAADETEKIVTEIAKVKEDIENAQKKEEELKEKKSKLDLERAELLRMKEECEELQEQIRVLEDTNLEQLPHEKEKLERDLIEKQKEEEILKRKKKQAEDQIEEAALKIKVLVKTIDDLKRDIVSTRERENELSEEKLSKENELKTMRQKVEDYEKWMKEFPLMSKEIESKYKEQRAEFTIMQNVWESALADDFLMDTLYKLPHAAAELSVENYPDIGIRKTALENIKELQEWFVEIGNRINSLLTVYERMVGCIVEQGELITAEQSAKERLEEKR